MVLEDENGLRYLIGTYFHQDWDLEGDSAAEVLEAFAAAEVPETRAAAREEADALLAEGLDDDELAARLEEMGLVYYSPETDGLTHREWLALIVERLAG
jgi:contact-dependent growth inhibition (CDI) system CdiI-like immunity protein